MDTSTPAQTRVRDELLAWGDERPVVDPDLALELRAALEDGARAVFQRHGRPAGGDGRDGGGVEPADRYEDTVWVSKSRLDRLVCDGLYRAALEEPFTYNTAIAAGTISHRAIELDHATRRGHSPEEVVAKVWHEVVTTPGDRLAAFANGLGDMDAASLRQDAEQLLTEHRDVWPALPSQLHVRFEQSVRVELLGGRVVLLGTPDLTLGRVRDDRARMLLVDLKTGFRRPEVERQELRFYALLLLTLKHGQPPFRWAAHYVAEGAWDVEDFSPALLDTAVRRVLDSIDQAVRLADPDAAERLRAGRWCRFCPRRDGCPEYLSQGDGTVGP